MKHIIPFACTLLILAACSSSRHNSSSLTLMSYNVGALCKFNEDSAPEVAYVIKSGLLLELRHCAVLQEFLFSSQR